MRNKGFVVVLTLIVTALCLFYLSFTFVSQRVQKQAASYATDKNGTVDLARKQAYLDSLWNLPVYNLGFKDYTYKEVKENELSLGLDLQGGMHVVLEISPADIIKGLSGNNSQDPALVAAFKKVQEMQKKSQESYTSLFYKAYHDANPDKKLAPLFASASNKGRVSLSDDDATVLKFLDTEIESAIDRSFTILKTRIDQFGTTQPNIQKLQGTGRIQIEIPGADNPQRVRKLLQGVARLEFWEVAEANDPQLNQALFAINKMLLKEKQDAAAALKDTGAKTDDLQNALASKTDTTLARDTVKSALEKELSKAKDSTGNTLDSLTKASLSPLFALSSQQIPFLYPTKDTAEINKIFNREDVRALLPRTIGLFWDVKPDANQTPGVEDIQLNFVNVGRSGKPLLSGEVINDARLDFDQFARPAVSMTMNPSGARAWAKITAAASAKQPQGRIAIVLDKYVYTAPTVQGEIPNGSSQITGNFTNEEAKDLANVLKAGSLPAPTRVVEEAIVGATLGDIAQKQGVFSMACGLIVVILFMVGYYAKGGWVANIGLLFNVFFLLGILAQFNAALTLPGIAGILLTLGMAVDANVLIYERIKEELRQGRVLREAINKGYERAFSSIFDANLVTLITAIFLFIFGQGPLKGFASSLIIGIITSFFTAVYISRVVIEWLVRKGETAKITFNTPLSTFIKKEPNFNFIGNRKKAYLFSTIVIVIGFALIFFQGLILGVDFKGGRSYTVRFNHPVEATTLGISLPESFEGTAVEVKNYGSNNVMKVTTSYLIDDESDEADEKVKSSLINGIEKFSKLQYTAKDDGVDDQHFTISSSTKVGATIADDIKNSAFKTGFLSLLAIFIYILIRFRKWQFSVGAIVALLHDSLFTFAAFGIARALGLSLEIDQIFIAALLTVIGYSINDTVVIFDRIREYQKFGATHSRERLFNDAINNTLGRTLITSFTTLFVVTILLFFGGEVLRGFSFALLVGIIIGTYSSIFIASPIVIDFDRSPDEVKSKA
jgi:SecD/SecF fusion protein